MQDVINLIFSQFFNLVIFLKKFELLPGLNLLTCFIILFLVKFVFMIVKGDKH